MPDSRQARMPNITRRWRCGIVGACIIGLGVCPAFGRGQDAAPVEVAEPAGGTSDLLVQLQHPDTTAEARAQAADAILQLLPDDPVVAEVAALLAAPAEGVAGQASRAILGAVSRTPLPPLQYYTPIAALARDAGSPVSNDAIRALRSYRTREAAAALVEILTEPVTSERQLLAMQSLIALTGRDDIPMNGWSAWFNHAVGLTEREWQTGLLAAHVRREQALLAEAQNTERKLAEAWSRIHLLTPQDQRSAVLAQLLESPTPALRALGFDLVSREIGEGRQLDPSVSNATIALLNHREPTVRAQAAQLLSRLAPPEAEAPVLAALARETDPATADALLLAVSRWASPAAVAPTLKWLKASPVTRLRAASTAWTLHRAGAIASPEDRQAVLDGVREVPDGEVTLAVCRLLAELGEPGDVERLRRLLTAESPAVRGYAADALAALPDEVSTLLTAAANDSAIFEACAKALRTHQRDAQGYDLLTQLPSPSPAVRDRVLGEYAALLPTDEIIRLATRTEDPAESAGLLRALLAANRASDPSTHAELASGLLLLARTNVALNNPNDALRALAVMPQPPAEAGGEDSTDAPGAQAFEETTAESRRLRLMLLVWLNRLNEADELAASAGSQADPTLADAWLDGLEHAIAEPHADAVANGISARFPGLSEAQKTRLASLRQQLASAKADAPPQDGG